MSHRESRREYEFPQRVKDEALNREQMASGHVHHILPVHVAKEYGVSPDLVKSPYNSQAMTGWEHRRIDHEGDFSQEVEWFLEMQPRLIPLEWEE